MEILSLVKMTRGMNKTPKAEYDKWKADMKAKNSVKRKLRAPSKEEEALQLEDAEAKEAKGGVDPNAVAETENELDFWLKGHMTGEKKERVGDEDKFDEASAVKSLEKRMNALESQM